MSFLMEEPEKTICFLKMSLQKSLFVIITFTCTFSKIIEDAYKKISFLVKFFAKKQNVALWERLLWNSTTVNDDH